MNHMQKKNLGNAYVSYLVETTPFVIRLCAKVYGNLTEEFRTQDKYFEWDTK